MKSVRGMPLHLLIGTVAITAAAVYSSLDLPRGKSTLFSGSGQCASCHQSDGTALTDPFGANISPPDQWRATMMANAAKDPVWRAKLSTEISANPALRTVIEDKCTTCHAPMGRVEALFHGADHYTVEEMVQDPLALDGVSCTVCHQIEDVGLGTDSSYSGNFVIGENRNAYGPFDDLLTGPMQVISGFRPVFSEHTSSSELCATCHTLFTPFLDNDGNIAGELPEQTTYLEWRNSVFVNLDVSCQTCHMPRLVEPVQITAFPPHAPERSPFGQHYFVGANVTMLRLMQANIDSLGITASKVNFDSTIARTLRQLQNATVDLEASYVWVGDSLQIDVDVQNLAGHKFPTGFPSRRAWLHVTVRDLDQNVVFESGNPDELTKRDRGRGEPALEPHHQMISRTDQTQIYQSVMADVDGNVTWTLLRGAEYIKDNRIPPEGFKIGHPDYEPAAIRGHALHDPDFNYDVNGEGSGSDRTTYRVGGIPVESPFTAEIELLYQTLSPGFVDDLLTYETPEVTTFASYWSDADQTPVTMETVVITSNVTSTSDEIPSSSFTVSPGFPNPFTESTQFTIQLNEGSRLAISIFDVSGRVVRRLVSEFRQAGDHRFSWDGMGQTGRPVPSGLYFIRLSTSDDSHVMKVAKTSAGS
jgi:hypothetical protein